MMVENSFYGYGGEERERIQQQKVVVEGQGKAVPAPFLTKSYELVEESKTDNIVSWGEDDTTFVVWRPSEFARDLLPNYFKHNNFSSFVRQLNTYGFRKIVPERWEFSNEFFKRGQKHLLCQIHRRKTSHFLPPPPPPHLPFSGGGGGGYFSTTVNTEDHYWLDSPPPSSKPRVIITTVEAQVTALTEENERLRRNNNVLMSELANMKKLYNDIIYFVQNHVKPVSPSPLVYNYNNAIGGNYTYSSSSSSSPPSSITTFIEDDDDVMMRTKTKLFGVSLQSSLNKKKKKKKKRFDHFSDQSNNLDNKTDLGLNLMTASSR